MTFFQWRRFNFFDLRKDVDGRQVAESLKDAQITCLTSGRGHIILGDNEGCIHTVSCDYEVTTFKAYDIHVTHVFQLKQTGILVTVGEDEPGINPLIKVWNQEKLDRSGSPMCVKICRAIPGNRPTPATAVTVHEGLGYLAVGFADGAVVLYRGDITRNRSFKQKILHEGCSTPITGLAFKTSSKAVHLFTVTESNISSYNVTVKDKEHKITLDSFGCASLCSVMADSAQEGHFMIGRDDAIYCYTPDGRGPCYAFEGEKVLLQWFRGYLVIVSRDVKSSARIPGTTSNTDSAAAAKFMITIFDTSNKFVTFSAAMREVINVLPEWGSLCILGVDKRVSCLVEKDLHSKLSLLFKKNLYDVAIRIAKSQQYDSEGLIDIFRQYGDHLYSKGDHNGAIEQYIKTIGKLEASYVIRKFLDAQRIHNLTAYLQALHKRGLATEDHTTLLLNCYTKLKDTQKLEEFITDCEVDFDVETAIRVCRLAGYTQCALALAKKHKQHEWYLKIQIEDHKNCEEALEYIGKLPFAEAEDSMKKYGSVLLENAPEAAIELLKRLCTYYETESATDKTEFFATDRKMISKPEEFMHLFIHNSSHIVDFLEHMIQVEPNCNPVLHNTLIEYYLHAYSQATDLNEKSHYCDKVMNVLQSEELKYDEDQVLVLCQIHKFDDGILYLYEKARQYQQLLDHHKKNKDYSAIIATCNKFGDKDSDLWVQTLWFAAQDRDFPASSMKEVLSAIEKGQLLSPLLVIDTLAKSPTATLGIVKDYLTRVLQYENNLIANDEKLIEQYRTETEKIRQQIHTIKTSAIIFQGSRCSACTHPLELPSVHFLCQHSFHLHCFESYSESEHECPACASENKKIQNIIKSQEQNRDLHEQFHNQLERADDGFSVLAQYFGHGLFNRVTFLDDDTVVKRTPAPAQRFQGPEPQLQTEARLRITETREQGPLNVIPESRMRSSERGVYIPVPPSSSESRLRLAEGRSTFQTTSSLSALHRRPDSQVLGGSLEQHITTVTDNVPRVEPSQKLSAVGIEESIANASAATGSNPFEEEYDESKNPFADDATNPFGNEDDYDKNLNPFAE